MENPTYDTFQELLDGNRLGLMEGLTRGLGIQKIINGMINASMEFGKTQDRSRVPSYATGGADEPEMRRNLIARTIEEMFKGGNSPMARIVELTTLTAVSFAAAAKEREAKLAEFNRLAKLMLGNPRDQVILAFFDEFDRLCDADARDFAQKKMGEVFAKNRPLNKHPIVMEKIRRLMDSILR